MDSDFSQNNKYTTKITPPNETLGVENELRRFAMNEYLNTKDKNVLIGTNDNVVDEDAPVDDLLLTNAVTENTVQDEVDKTRYLKETKSYVTINSAARQMSVAEAIEEAASNGTFTRSLFTTGGKYGVIFSFAPYRIVKTDDNIFIQRITTKNNHIRFRLQDWTTPTDIVQVMSPATAENFNVFLPINPLRDPLYTLDEFQFVLGTSTNLVAATGVPLDHSVDPKHMFSVNVSYNPNINPDRAIIQITCQSNFRYAWDFYSLGDLPATPTAEPIPASDAAFVVQTPDANYPFPNSYALDLNKAYTIVKSIRIISSEMPNTDTIITNLNNHITFQLIDTTLPPPTKENPYSQNIKTKAGSIDWEVFIPAGNYTLAQLVDQMNTQINGMLMGEAGLSNVFTITANEITGVFEIATHIPYAFKWNFNADPDLLWRNLYQMLGFPLSALNEYSVTFDNQVNVNIGQDGHIAFVKRPFKAIMLRKSDVIWLQLNNYETIYDTLTRNNYFCKFMLDNVENNQFAYNTFTPSVHVFIDAPIPVLSQVDVRLYDEVGMPYNFRGVDHSFTLEITHHIDRLMGTDYSSRRGVNDKSSYV